MKRVKVVLRNSDEGKWEPIVPDTTEQRLWAVACSNK